MTQQSSDENVYQIIITPPNFFNILPHQIEIQPNKPYKGVEQDRIATNTFNFHKRKSLIPTIKDPLQRLIYPTGIQRIVSKEGEIGSYAWLDERILYATHPLRIPRTIQKTIAADTINPIQNGIKMSSIPIYTTKEMSNYLAQALEKNNQPYQILNPATLNKTQQSPQEELPSSAQLVATYLGLKQHPTT